MNKIDKYINDFTAKAVANGYDDVYIDACLGYAKPLLENGFPVIYNTSHLSALTGYNKKYIKRAARNTSNFYRVFNIPKSSGGTRTISEPLPSLKVIQRWIKDHILENITISRFAKAYVSGRSLKDHVRWHTNQNKVLTIDLKDFFGSISMPVIEKVFLELGYSRILSNLLAKVCTLDNALPQGAPTSSVLSNITLREIDQEIFAFCKNRKIRFSRYADDMAFSGNFDHLEVIDFIKDLIHENGLYINDEKTKVMYPNQRQVVCGVIVNEKPQVSKRRRNEIRKSVYYIKKYGIQSHLSKIKETRANYVYHLLGVVNYILFLNPNDSEFLNYKEVLEQVIE